MRSRLSMTAAVVLLLISLSFLAPRLVPSAEAQAQGTYTASFSVSGTNSATGANYSATGHFTFTTSNLTGTGGAYFLSVALAGSCSGHFTFNGTVVYAATYNSATNQLSFTQLSGGMPPSGYVTYTCGVGTGGTYSNYMTSTPFKASPFNLSLASGATTQLSGIGYFGSVRGEFVVLSGTTVVTSFSSTASATSTTSSVSFSLTSTATGTSAPSSSATSSGGGIPEFPYQLFATVILTAVILAAYLVARRAGRVS